jgi:hypothetical protein
MSLSIYKNDVYRIRESSKGVLTLVYEYKLEGRVYYRAYRGRVSGWRRNAFRYLAQKLGVKQEIWDYNTGARLSVFIRLLPKIATPSGAYSTADTLANMGLEEVSFWGWKLNQMGRQASKAFKAMYGVR